VRAGMRHLAEHPAPDVEGDAGDDFGGYRPAEA